MNRLCRFQAKQAKTHAGVASSRWHSQTRLGKAHGNICNCQEEASIAVLQDHVTGKVFNIQPRNIAKKNRCFTYVYGVDWSLFKSIEASILKLWPAFY